MAVGDDVHLPRRLVGPDVHILPQGAYRVHRQLPMLRVPHHRDVGMDALQHLAAVSAPETGLALLPADVGRSDEPRRAQQIAVAGEHDGVAQPSLLRRAAYRPGQCAVFCRKLGHGALLSSAGPDSPIILMYQYNTGKAGQASFIRRIAGKMFPVTRFPTMNRNQLQKNRKIWE